MRLQEAERSKSVARESSVEKGMRKELTTDCSAKTKVVRTNQLRRQVLSVLLFFGAKSHVAGPVCAAFTEEADYPG